MQKYYDRYEAGKLLAEQLQSYAHQPDVIILALPRGGVPVAFEIATMLSAPLDVFIVRKLGVPVHKELAFGAIATGGITVFNDDIVVTLLSLVTLLKKSFKRKKSSCNAVSLHIVERVHFQN